MPFIVDGNEYLSQRSAIYTIAIDEVDRNPGHFFGRRNDLVEFNRILGANGLERHFALFHAPLVIEVSLELSRKEDDGNG
jgi:hypothetical protein